MIYSLHYPQKIGKNGARPTTQADQTAARKKVNEPADRVKELMESHTVAELREIAKGLGLTVGGRAKEETIATQIYQHEVKDHEPSTNATDGQNSTDGNAQSND